MAMSKLVENEMKTWIPFLFSCKVEIQAHVLKVDIENVAR